MSAKNDHALGIIPEIDPMLDLFASFLNVCLFEFLTQRLGVFYLHQADIRDEGEIEAHEIFRQLSFGIYQRQRAEL